MSTKLGKEFDIQDYLIQSESSPQAFFKACVEEDPGDGSLVRIRPDMLSGRIHHEADHLLFLPE